MKYILNTKHLIFIIITLIAIILNIITYIIEFSFILLWSFKIAKYSSIIRDDIELTLGENNSYTYIDHTPIDTCKRWWWFLYELDAQWYDKENKYKLPKNIKKI